MFGWTADLEDPRTKTFRGSSWRKLEEINFRLSMQSVNSKFAWPLRMDPKNQKNQNKKTETINNKMRTSSLITSLPISQLKGFKFKTIYLKNSTASKNSGSLKKLKMEINFQSIFLMMAAIWAISFIGLCRRARQLSMRDSWYSCSFFACGIYWITQGEKLTE